MPQVEPAALTSLLELQEEDSAIIRLRQRRETLPEARRLAEVSEALAELDADLQIATKQHEELAREQARLEGEIELLEQKIGKEEGRMYSGAVANPKELSSLQAEVEMLKKKRETLEDSLLETMVQRDHASKTRESVGAERAETAREAAELADVVAALHAEIDAELAARGSRRAEIATMVPRDVLDLYDRIRAQRAGVGAAALRSRTCEGCHTKLPAKEVERIRSEGGLQRCDNCRRILVSV